MKPRISGRLRLAGMLLGGALAAACGGNALMGGGIAGTSSVVAPISGFGSIFVGGIEFDTATAIVTIEGDPALVSDLKLGMVATVRGTVDARGRRGVAQRVAVEHLAEGPIESIDGARGTLRVLEQQVLTDSSTVFDPALDQLAPGDYLEIGGFFDASGRIRATRVARPQFKREIAVKGFVDQLDVVARTFRLEDLTVDFGNAVVTGAPPAGLRDGLLVEAAADVPSVGGVLSATDVEVKDPSSQFDEGDGLKVEGFVTAIQSSTDLVVNGSQAVRISDATRFVNGARADLVLDARVDVDGVAGPGGVLVALKVDFAP